MKNSNKCVLRQRMKASCLLFLSVLAVGSATGTIFVKDSVPIGTTGYSSVVKLPGQNPTTNAIIGTSGIWSGATGTIFAKVNNFDYPVNVNASSSGGSFGITYSVSGSTTGRATSRLISGTSLPSSGTLYFSTLINVDTTAISKLANGQAYYIGVSRTDYNAADATVLTFPASGVFIGFKNESGTVAVSLGVNGTSYPLVPSATAGQTYFCVVEIQLNTGANGEETVTAVVDPDGPTMSGTYSATTSAANVVATGTTFTYMTVGGLYATGNGSVYFDEFRMTDSNYEACPIDLGGFSIISTEPDSVGYFSATAVGSLSVEEGDSATIYLDWGTAEDALNTTTNLGLYSEAVAVSNVLDNLKPDTTYYYRHRAVDGANAVTSLVTKFFTTLGAVSFGDVLATNSLTTAFYSGTLAEPGAADTTVSLLIGSSSGSLSLAQTWNPVSVATNFDWAVADCTFGATYYYAFKAEYTYGGETYTYWSSTNALLISADAVWTGIAGDSDWHNGGNWDIGVVPFAESVAKVLQGASIAASSNGVAKTLQVDSADPVAIDFSGNSLETPTVLAGTELTSSLALSGNYDVDTLFQIGGSAASGSDVTLTGGSMLAVGNLEVGYSSANNTLSLLDGASVVAGSEVEIRTTSSKYDNTIYVGTGAVFTAQAGIRVEDCRNFFIVDGGVVTNTGGYYNGARDSNATWAGAELNIINGGFMKQVGLLRGSPWYKAYVRVMNGGVLEAGAITLGSDNDSGRYSRFIVSNATVTASSLRVPGDDRHGDEGMMIYEDAGRTSSVAISGDMNLGVYGSTRTSGNNRNNFLNLYGGSLSVGGAFTMGNSVVAAHSNNVIRLSGKTSMFSAGSFIACNNCRIEYTVPPTGFEQTPIQVSGAASIDSTIALKVDASALVSGGLVTLISAGTLTCPDTEAKLTLSIPDGYSYALIQNETTLAIRIIRSGAGTLIIIN